MNQGEIVMRLFLKTNGQFAKAIVPRIGALHHPATGGMATRRVGFEFRLSSPSAMRPVAQLADPLPDLLGVVAFV